MNPDTNLISRRLFLKTVVGSISVHLTGCLFEEKKTSLSAENYNILYIMTDQQPASCVSAYNPKIRTPNLASLADRGCVFDNFYIAAFPCAPSRASQLTGRYMHNHLVVKNEIMLDNDIPSLGKLCKKAGYNTGYFGKWHLGGWIYRGIQHRSKRIPRGFVEWHYERVETENGWDTKVMPGGPGDDHPQHGFDTWKGGWTDYKDWLRKKGKAELLKNDKWVGGHFPAVSSIDEGTHIYSKLPEDEHMAAFFVDETNKFIEKNANSGKPWCCVLSFYGPHPPVTPPKPWDTMYSLDEIPLPLNHRDPRRRINYKLNDWTEEQFKDYIRRYWGYCSYIDKQIGRTLDRLKQTGQDKKTIVVFTSDHGDMVGTHGMFSKSGDCGFEELFRVPTIIYIPGVSSASTRIDSLASNIDLLPTLLDAAKIGRPSGMDGKSLLPVLKGSVKTHRRTVFAEGQSGIVVCRHNNYKLVMNWRYKAPQEFYDLEADPGEMNDLINDEKYKTQVDKLRKMIINWAQTTGHRYAGLIEENAMA